jgi:hypothetical protein
MRKLSILLILICLPTAVFAQDDPDWRNRRASRDRGVREFNTFELTPIVGYRYGGTVYASETNLFTRDVDVASHMNYGVNFGIPIAGGMKLELMVNRQNTHFTSGSGLFEADDNIADFDVTYYHAGLQVPFRVSRNATPYFIISGGIANLRPDIQGVSAENKFSASFGGGVKLPFSNNAGVRLEARGYFTSVSDRDDCSRCFRNYENRDLYQGETSLGFYFKF